MSEAAAKAPEHADASAAPGRATRRAAGKAASSVTAAAEPAHGTPLPVEAMTSRQLVRRAKLIEAVIDLVREVGPGAVQVRDVADRSGTALGTVYRYFGSKEHLLATALCDWQERLTRRVLIPRAGDEAEEGDLTERVLSYVRKEIRGFARNPRIAELMVQVHVSSDPYARDALARMSSMNDQVMEKLLAGVAPERAEAIKYALGSILMNSLTYWVTGRTTLPEMTHQVESVARLVLEHAAD
ncbi:MAG: regulatory protein TetR [Actinomycetia bacterium]|nr:regulatory protein TetR [Actinomycetes bacterium]